MVSPPLQHSGLLLANDSVSRPTCRRIFWPVVTVVMWVGAGCGGAAAPPSEPVTPTGTEPAVGGIPASTSGPPVTRAETSKDTTSFGDTTRPFPIPPPKSPPKSPSLVDEKVPELSFEEAKKSLEVAEIELRERTSDCTSLCKAISSMKRATERLCTLAREDLEKKRCSDARERVGVAEKKVAATCRCVG